jgi:hypothetical protein
MMKTALSALALAAVCASAAPALSPVFTASFDAPSQTCDLQLFEPRLVALANPAEAASWSLSVEAPGFVNQQSGPVTGPSSRLRPVTRLLMGGFAVADGQVYGGSSTMPRPFYAELTVFDADGVAICSDVIDLPERSPLGAQGWSGRPR